MKRVLNHLGDMLLMWVAAWVISILMIDTWVKPECIQTLPQEKVEWLLDK